MLTWRMRLSDAKEYEYIAQENVKLLQKRVICFSHHQEVPAAYQMAEFAWKIFSLPLIIREHLPNAMCLNMFNKWSAETETDRQRPEFCFSVISICCSDTLVWRMTVGGHPERVCECVFVKALIPLMDGKPLSESVRLYTVVLGSPLRPENI